MLKADKSGKEFINLCNNIDNFFGFEYVVDHGDSSTKFKPHDWQPQLSSNIDGYNAVRYNINFYKWSANSTSSSICSGESSIYVLPTTSAVPNRVAIECDGGGVTTSLRLKFNMNNYSAKTLLEVRSILTDKTIIEGED